MSALSFKLPAKLNDFLIVWGEREEFNQIYFYVECQQISSMHKRYIIRFVGRPSVCPRPLCGVRSRRSVLKLPSNLFFAERGETSPFARLGDLDTDSGILIGTDLSLTLGTELDAPFFDANQFHNRILGRASNAWDHLLPAS